jgi:hypothetical protein
MRRFLRWAVLVPSGAILVLFLVANRKPVALSLDPFSTAAPALATPALPLWLWLVVSLLIGLLIGAAGMWASDRELRIRARADRLELKHLKKAAAERPPGDPPPAPPEGDGR